MLDDLLAVIDLFSQSGFVTGFLAGLVVLGLLYVASLVIDFPIGWGVGFVAAVVLVLNSQFEIESALITGLGFVLLAGGVVDLTSRLKERRLRYAAWTIGFGVLSLAVVGFSTTAHQPDLTWLAITFPLVVLVMGASIWRVSTGAYTEFLGPMLAVTVVGIWVTVPETAMARVLLGVGLPIALATLSPTRARSSAAGAFALAGFIAWLTIIGGEARPHVIIGSWGAIGILPLVPLISSLDIRPRRWMVLGVHVAYVIVITRVVDFSDSLAVAVLALIILTILSALALMLAPAHTIEHEVADRAEAAARI